VQCLLMANESMVTNIVDLWVATAMNVDNEEVFENDDTELGGPNESVFDLDGDDQNDNSPTGAEDTATKRGKHIAGMSSPSMPSTCHSSHAAPFCCLSSPQHQVSQSPQWHHPSLQYGTSGHPFDVAAPPCCFSNTVPGIFTHPGVRTPPAIAEAQRLLNAPDPSQAQDGADNIASMEGLHSPLATHVLQPL
jgi:hypothetical protein